MLENGLVSLDLHCFLRLSSAGLIVVMDPAVGVAGLLLPFPCNTKDAALHMSPWVKTACVHHLRHPLCNCEGSLSDGAHAKMTLTTPDDQFHNPVGVYIVALHGQELCGNGSKTDTQCLLALLACDGVR